MGDSLVPVLEFLPQLLGRAVEEELQIAVDRVTVRSVADVQRKHRVDLKGVLERVVVDGGTALIQICCFNFSRVRLTVVKVCLESSDPALQD